MESRANLIKRIRLENGLTQTQLAKRLGTNQANVSRWENGEVAPTDLSMAKMQKKLKWPADAYDFINSTLPGQTTMFQ